MVDRSKKRAIIAACGLYFITDRALSRRGVVHDVSSTLRAGVRVVQYREKNLPTNAMIKVVDHLRILTRRHHALLIINDRVDIALAVQADGVHLGQEDMPIERARCLLGANALIGVTAHNLKEARKAERAGADYLGVSPVFTTATKKDAGKPSGLSMLRRIVKGVRVPVVAIGGITEQKIPSVLQTGACSVAMISAIIAQNDVYATTKRVLAAIASPRPVERGAA